MRLVGYIIWNTERDKPEQYFRKHVTLYKHRQRAEFEASVRTPTPVVKPVYIKETE
jgi:hypothetical protein